MFSNIEYKDLNKEIKDEIEKLKKARLSVRNHQYNHCLYQ